MAPKEPTRQQLSSRLTYQSKTPAFLLKLQNQVAGRSAGDDEYEPQIVDDDDELGGVDEFGRERRRVPSSLPVTNAKTEPLKLKGNDPYRSDEEDDEDEKPVIVVVKEGKHLSEREVENEKRKAQGLAPLRHEDEDDSDDKQLASTSKSSAPHHPEPQTKLDRSVGLSFSSSSSKKDKPSGSKRKVVLQDDEQLDKPSSKKKSKRSQKGSLSFDQNDVS